MTSVGLVIANLRRNPLRTALTGGAMALATALVCMLLTLPASFTRMLEQGDAPTRIIVQSRSGYELPQALARRIREVDGVVAATPMTWFGGAFEERGRVTFPSFAVEPEHVGAVFPDYAIPPVQLEAFRARRSGALVGRATLRKYGWQVGDRITLESTVWPIALELEIMGEIPNPSNPIVWLHWDYVDAALREHGQPGLGQAQLVWARVGSRERVDEILRTIDDLSRNSDAETTSRSEKAFLARFFGSLQQLIRIILVVSAIVSVCIAFIAGNSFSMNVRERSREIATLKALGFRPRRIFAACLSESVALAGAAGVGGILGALACAAGLRMVSGWSEVLGPLGSFQIGRVVLLQAILLSLSIGIVAGFAAALSAARHPAAEGLREVF